ncbi:hypothetical protein D187_005458 [Cystobacter fuscus DSM 2262]|uniref:Rhs family protein n=1 Tax=Cystobacter fuscus (strain ATCC 25194 / DSM 2262 / NBRC 100088 / M29) TaxID=1242864 RepID=S9QSN4_CYSF2|nr:RHS repeat domain-containing protein [Cystobacter fuscus]EPX64324.1 hypothetical protein D187_005458 [Cystobacter fuscus DSM 2262]
MQPSGRRRHLSYDETGRLTRVEYGDGTFSAFRYRPDGALVEAENESSKVTLERDAGGLEVARWMPGGVEANRLCHDR